MRNTTSAERKISKNVTIVVGVLIFLWCILIIRLFTLQIIQYDYYKAMVLSNVQKTTTTKAVRGVIYDSEMNKLAANYTSYRIFISPHDIETNEEETIARGLSQILDVEYEKILSLTKNKVRWDTTILKKATEEQAEAVNKFKTENGFKLEIFLEANQTRYYPYGSLASHVIGVVGSDGGLTGLEYQYNSYLSGESGKVIISKDAAGNQIYSEYDTYLDVSNGANLVTTINNSIQSALEEQLIATYTDSSPLDRVTGIVMDVNTGAVLAMATYPNFDLNNPFVLDEQSLLELQESGIAEGTDEYTQMQTDLLYTLWNNKAVTDTYEPGSTFKIITTASALEEGAVTFDDIFTCEGRYMNSYCHKHKGHGTVTFRVGLQQSCNPTLMQVSQRLGVTRFWDYLVAFGYKEKSGIDLPGEASSITHSKANFSEGNMLAYSFGQSFKVTPIRHLTSICAVANGGYLLEPYVVDRIIDDNGKIIYQHEKVVKRQIISEEICKQIWEVLEEGTSGDGQAKNAYVSGYKIAAKTGTSEVLDLQDEEGNYSYRVGSTVAFAPADNPQIAALIIVDKPTTDNKYGGTVAAPYISKLMEKILPIIGIEKHYSATDIKKVVKTMRGYGGWETSEALRILKNLGFTYVLKGDGKSIKYQIPAKGTQIVAAESTVYLYCGTAVPEYNISVPNCVGMTINMASKKLKSLGLNVMVDGATNTTSSTEALVLGQSLEPETMATKGMVITLTAIYDTTA